MVKIKCDIKFYYHPKSKEESLMKIKFIIVASIIFLIVLLVGCQRMAIENPEEIKISRRILVLEIQDRLLS